MAIRTPWRHRIKTPFPPRPMFIFAFLSPGLLCDSSESLERVSKCDPVGHGNIQTSVWGLSTVAKSNCDVFAGSLETPWSGTNWMPNWMNRNHLRKHFFDVFPFILRIVYFLLLFEAGIQFFSLRHEDFMEGPWNSSQTKYSSRAQLKANWCYRSLVIAWKMGYTEDPFYGNLVQGPHRRSSLRILF